MSTLTISDASALAEILHAAQGNKIVARLVDGHVFVGTARSIGDDRGNLATGTDDVRDCYLRVTTLQGWEAFWPVRDLMAEVTTGKFAPDYS